MTAIQVDPYEALVNLAAADTAGIAAAVGSQVALQHRYGQDSGDWPMRSSSLIIGPGAGVPELYVEVQGVIAEARCYGDTPADCALVHKALVGWTRHNGRREIAVTGGTALVYFVVVLTQPALFYDEMLNDMPYFLVLLQASVAEELVA
jgi:hypothetical protein